MKTIYLLLYNRTNKKYFKKYFNTEWEKDKFKEKLKYSKRLILIEDPLYLYYN